MERLDDGRIALTEDEAQTIVDFIDRALDTDWDRYTDTFICQDKWEDGKRRINPEMYAFMEQLQAVAVDLEGVYGYNDLTYTTHQGATNERTIARNCDPDAQ